MLSLMFRVRTVACAIVVVLLVACGGDSPTQVGGNPPPTVEVVTVTSLSPTEGSQVSPDVASFPLARVAISANATSNVSGSSLSITYTFDNSPVSNPLNVMAGPGTHKVCAVASSNKTVSQEKCATFLVVSPTFSGKVVVPTATGEYIPQGVYVIFGDKGAEDSVKVGNDGSFSLNSRYAALSSCVHVVVRGDPNTNWLSGCVSSSFFGNMIMIGAPKSFTPASGDFAGQKFSIDMVKATQDAPLPSNTSYFQQFGIADTTSHVYPAGSWKSLPVCLAFAVAQGNDHITSGDSLGYWSSISTIEKKYGIDLVKPCSEDEAKASGGVVVALRFGTGAEGAGVLDGAFDDYLTAKVFFSDHQNLSDEFLVQHTFGHAFFENGHTCAWDSIMRSSCPRGVPNAISGEDVVYNLLKIRTRELERKYNTRLSFALSINGSRLAQGLSELKMAIVDGKGNPIP